MSEQANHAAYVTVDASAARNVPMLYQAKCPTCGKVGHPQHDRGDAEAIARRHTEIGGFER